MPMIARTAQKILKKYLKSFPAVVLTGARQVGKTTLLKMSLSKTHRYVLLEDPDVRAQALEDPRSFSWGFSGAMAKKEIGVACMV